ncbi:MAG: alginate export family protein [Limisphaerales bacterium]
MDHGLRRKPNRLVGALWRVIVFLGLAPTFTCSQAAQPWRLQDHLGLPEWLQVSGNTRVFYETMDDQFRVGGVGGDQLLTWRTMLKMTASRNGYSITGELVDVRGALADTGTPLGTDDINTLEPLQAYLGWNGESATGDKLDLRFGRQTMNLGARRFLARNVFRSTLNAFNGVRLRWERPERMTLNAFYFLPQQRRPSTPASLLANDAALDEERFNLQYWGLHNEFHNVWREVNVELQFFGLHEEDTPNRATRNRNLYTPAIRFSRKPGIERFDLDLESAVQFGESRATGAAGDTTDLDHLAHRHTLESGYTFGIPWSPRVAIQYEYASGDDSAGDGDNNRFDTLFGVRRPGHGPTGIWGGFAHINVNSPGYRITAKPRKDIQFMWSHRWYWLASDTDAWVPQGVRDPAGTSGRFIGHQIETRLRWEAVPGNLKFETGAAHLFAGEFLRRAPNSNGQRDSTYGYFQVELTF